MSLYELKEFSTKVYSRGRRLSHDLTSGIYSYRLSESRRLNTAITYQSITVWPKSGHETVYSMLQKSGQAVY